MSVFQNKMQGPDAPATMAAAVTPSDVNSLAPYCRSIYIGVSGDVAVVMADDSSNTAVTFKNVPVGVLPICAKLVLATGTTATDIVAMW